MTKFFGNRISLLWQYFFSYLIVILILVFIISTYSYSTFYDYHTKIIRREYQEALKLIRERNESEILLLLNSSYQLAALSFSFEERPEKYIQLKNQMSVFSSCNNFFSGMYLFFNEGDYVFTNTTLYKMDTFVSKANKFSTVTDSELLNALLHTNNLRVLPEQHLYRWGNWQKDVVPVFVPIGYLNGTRIGTIMYEIEANTYNKLLGGIATGNKSVYIMDGSNIIFSREACGASTTAALTAFGELAGDNTFTEFRYEGNNYQLFYIPGEKLELSYLMIVAADETISSFSVTAKLFMYIISIAFVVCLLLVIYFVRTRVRPIIYLHRILTNGRAHGNELLEIKESVERLISDNFELAVKIENSEALLKEDFARRFLVGGFSTMDEWLSKAEDIHLDVDMKYFVVAILAKPVGFDYELTPDKLTRFFDGIVSGVACTPGLTEQAILVAFANSEQQLFEWLESKLSVMKALCAGITMAVSATHSGYADGPLAYLEAENAFESRFILGNKNAIRFNPANETEKPSSYDHKLVERLSMSLKTLDADRVRSVLDNISRAMRAINTSLFMFRRMYYDILSVIAKEAGGSSTLEQEVIRLYRLSTCLSLDELDIMLHNICIKLIEEHKKPNNANIPSYILQAREIIRKRYAEPGISVSAVAQDLGMSESRLSLDFKAAYQMTPYEYLIELRMTQACRLLKMTSIHVKDIAIECGYYDISGFNRRFKSYTGKTPQQYRISSENDTVSQS